MKPVRIGICEQNRIQRELLCSWVWQFCSLNGFEPQLAAYPSSADLLEAMRLCRFDVILLSGDGPDGFLSVRQVRENDAQTRIVFLTDTSRYAVMGIRLHLSDYIVKPVEFKQIIRAMKLCGVTGGGG